MIVFVNFFNPKCDLGLFRVKRTSLGVYWDTRIRRKIEETHELWVLPRPVALVMTIP